ncbi:MAG: LamG-like jellyroll fold domain-containing protein [Pseudomonadota bacterium]
MAMIKINICDPRGDYRQEIQEKHAEAVIGEAERRIADDQSRREEMGSGFFISPPDRKDLIYLPLLLSPLGLIGLFGLGLGGCDDIKFPAPADLSGAEMGDMSGKPDIKMLVDQEPGDLSSLDMGDDMTQGDDICCGPDLTQPEPDMSAQQDIAQPPLPDLASADLSTPLKNVLQLHFDEGIGSATRDSSGIGNDGQLSDPLAQWGAGKIGKAVYFSGADNTQNAKVGITKPIGLGSNAFTISFDVYLNSLGTKQTVAIYLDAQKNEAFKIYAKADGTLAFHTPACSDAAVTQANQALKTAQWYSVKIQHDGGQPRMSIDGNVADSSACALNIPDGGTLIFGVETLVGGKDTLNGGVDEWEIWQGLK